MGEMVTSKTIYLFRHPETEAPKGVCYGNSDVLPSANQLQAAVAKIKNTINGIEPDIIYSSPLSRCSMLANQLAKDSKVVTDELLREIDFGKWEMLPWSDVPDNEREAWGKDYISNKIHGGENFFDVQERVVQFWKKIVATDYTKIFIVAHAGLFRALLSHLLDASPYKIFAVDIDYGSTICVQWDNEAYYKIKFL